VIGFRADRYDISAAGNLAPALDLSFPAAAILARRGYADPDRAREFLAADERHDPDRFAGIGQAVATVLEAVGESRQITVYGDFDADGVCATAILVGAIRELGGRCDWFIPDRIADGYGLNPEAIRTLAARGTGLMVTVDCGVTAVDEVALARELGLEVIVTDHHQADPGRLPDCPVLHPVISGYPFRELCGAAVAAKLATGLRREAGADPAGDERDLDLIALATVADVMPLTGENRRLVREGIEVARRARRPGMAVLIDECRIAPEQLDAGDFGFRLAPRINAAGRMYRADAGVELFLSDDPERAREIARELAGANAERRRVEREVLAEAEKALAAREDPGPAIVVAGEGWHPGVVGIVASRLVRAHGRPSVVISLDGDQGRGSARSVPGLNLHDALGDASAELLGFGGHAAAAGLTIEAARVDSFRERLGEAVSSRIGTGPVLPELRFDAVAGGPDLGLDLAEELQRLGPFGNGNPDVRLLIPGARVTGLSEIGDGKHCRFTVVSGGNRASGVCFGRNSLGVEEGERVDLLAELGPNHWNGSTRARLVVRESVPLPEGDPLAGCEAAEWWERFERRLESDAPAGSDPAPAGTQEPPERERLRWAGLPGVRIGELISSGSTVAIITADANRRWRVFGGTSGLARFNPDATAQGLWEGSPEADLEAVGDCGILLTDYRTLGRAGPGLPDRFEEVILLDPPDDPAALASTVRGEGRLHLVYGPEEFRFAEAVATHRFDLTGDLRDLYRALRDGAAADDGKRVSAEELRIVLSGDPLRPRSPERAALLVRVLGQSDLLHTEGKGAARVLGVVSSVQVELSVSADFGARIIQQKERIEFLRRSQRAN